MIKKTRYMSALLAAVLLCTALCSCARPGAGAEDTEGSTDTETGAPETGALIPLETEGATPLTVSEVYPLYATLSPQLQTLYRLLLGACDSGKTEVRLPGSAEDAGAVFEAMWKDRPDYFFLTGAYTASECTDDTVLFYPVYTTDWETITRQRAELDAAAAVIVTAAQERETLYEQLIYVHDTVAIEVSYDRVVYELLESNREAAVRHPAASAYGALTGGLAICSSYAAAFQLLTQRLGIPCGRVAGTDTTGRAHGWNYVELEGEYYYVDVTWDDSTGSLPGDAVFAFYDYFCVTADELSRDHAISETDGTPPCRGEKYNYFKYYDLDFKVYSQKAVERTVGLRFDGSCLPLRFASAEDAKNACDDLYDGGFARIESLQPYLDSITALTTDNRTLYIFLRK